MSDLKRFTVCIENEAYKKIRVIAAESEISVSEYVRLSIRDKIAKFKAKLPSSS